MFYFLFLFNFKCICSPNFWPSLNVKQVQTLVKEISNKLSDNLLVSTPSYGNGNVLTLSSLQHCLAPSHTVSQRFCFRQQLLDQKSINQRNIYKILTLSETYLNASLHWRNTDDKHWSYDCKLAENGKLQICVAPNTMSRQSSPQVTIVSTVQQS